MLVSRFSSVEVEVVSASFSSLFGLEVSKRAAVEAVSRRTSSIGGRLSSMLLIL